MRDLEKRLHLLHERKNILEERKSMTLEELGNKYGTTKQGIRSYINNNRQRLKDYNRNLQSKSPSQ